MIKLEKPNGKCREGGAKLSSLRCTMVGQEAMDVSCNTVRYKEIYFIFYHENDQRLEQVPREVFESLSMAMLKIWLYMALSYLF